MMLTMLIHESADTLAQRTDPARAPAYWGAWRAYAQAINEAGIVRAGAGLEMPAAATLVRRRGDAPLVLDGPYAETKEQLGGFFLLEVPDLETALAWASRCPAAADGTIELRPNLSMPG